MQIARTPTVRAAAIQLPSNPHASMFSAPVPCFSTLALMLPLNGFHASAIGSWAGFNAVPSAVAEVLVLRKPRSEQPRELVANDKPGIFQPARHPVIASRRAADHEIGARLQHPEHFARPLLGPRLKAAQPFTE
jgi:hypothetical protein